MCYIYSHLNPSLEGEIELAASQPHVERPPRLNRHLAGQSLAAEVVPQVDMVKAIRQR